jgi:plasmid stability protein
MSDVPALHIRNVPEQVVATLKRRAKENGRSLNSEVVEILEDSGRRYEQAADLLRELGELRAEWLLPDDAPKPEDVIREARDERAREIDRRVRGL